VAFADFAEIKKLEMFRIVPVPSWGGNVRLNKPNALTLMPVISRQDKFDKDDTGKFLNDEEAIEFATSLLSVMIADEDGALQFNSDDGRDRLKREFGAIQTLLEDAIELCGIGEKQAKKKRKSRR